MQGFIFKSRGCRPCMCRSNALRISQNSPERIDEEICGSRAVRIRTSGAYGAVSSRGIRTASLRRPCAGWRRCPRPNRASLRRSARYARSNARHRHGRRHGRLIDCGARRSKGRGAHDQREGLHSTGRFGHRAKCARISVAVSWAPQHQPQGIRGPEGRPPISIRGTPRRHAQVRHRPDRQRGHSGLKASTGDS